MNSTVEELMYYAQAKYAETINAQGQYQLQMDHTASMPTYFKEAYLAGLNIAPNQFSGLIPIVAIYKIDWAAYNAANGIS